MAASTYCISSHIGNEREEGKMGSSVRPDCEYVCVCVCVSERDIMCRVWVVVGCIKYADREIGQRANSCVCVRLTALIVPLSEYITLSF